MAEVKVFHDREGQTLTVWFTDPSLEYVSEETGDEVVLMKDRSGRVFGFAPPDRGPSWRPPDCAGVLRLATLKSSTGS